MPTSEDDDVTDMREALELAADTIKGVDGGDPKTETGWKSDELLDVWLKARTALDTPAQGYNPLAAVALDHIRRAETAAGLARDKLVAALSAPGGEVVREALEPFAEFADGSGGLPDEFVITTGSAMARKQLTMGDCRRARAAFAVINSK